MNFLYFLTANELHYYKSNYRLNSCKRTVKRSLYHYYCTKLEVRSVTLEKLLERVITYKIQIYSIIAKLWLSALFKHFNLQMATKIINLILTISPYC